MEIIYHINQEDLDILVQRVVTRLRSAPIQKTWLTPQEAMGKLNLKSKTSLYHLRTRGEITYTQPRKRKILYSAESIDRYLSRNIKERF